MFKRRKPLTPLQHLRELCWPTMGWRRAFKYVHLRITRMSDSTHKIAGGLAVGTSIAFTPILGTHFIQAGFLSWIFRLNILCAIIGTFLANPWTIPFIWWGSVRLGAWIFYWLGLDAEVISPHEMNFHELMFMLHHKPFTILLPWLTGGYTMAIVFWLPAYFLFYYLVRGAKIAKVKAKLRAAHVVAKEVTGQTT